MRKLFVRSLITLIASVPLAQAAAVPSVIGVASARGAFRLDDAKVTGNATLFDGAVLETGKATSDVRLETGVQVLLGTDSRCKLYREHMVLERGTSQVQNLGKYQVQAGKLRIVPTSSTSKGLVELKSANLVEVAASSGGFRVMTNSGVLLAKLMPGQPLAFDTEQEGATAPTEITGVVTKEGGHFFVSAPATGVKYEIVGDGLGKVVGKTVSLQGTIDTSQPAVEGASAVMHVTNMTVVGSAAGGAGAGAAAAGMAVGTKVIIIGVVVAAAGTGIGVGIAKANESSSPASR